MRERGARLLRACAGTPPPGTEVNGRAARVHVLANDRASSATHRAGRTVAFAASMATPPGSCKVMPADTRETAAGMNVTVWGRRAFARRFRHHDSRCKFTPHVRANAVSVSPLAEYSSSTFCATAAFQRFAVSSTLGRAWLSMPTTLRQIQSCGRLNRPALGRRDTHIAQLPEPGQGSIFDGGFVEGHVPIPQACLGARDTLSRELSREPGSESTRIASRQSVVRSVALMASVPHISWRNSRPPCAAIQARPAA